MALPGRRVISFGLDAPPGDEDFGLIEVGEERWLAHGKSPLLAAGDLRIAGLHNAANALAMP